MTAPIVSVFTHKAISVQAIQFDGTITGLLSIFDFITDHSDLVVTIRFDPNGNVASVFYGMASATLSFGSGDWLVFSPVAPLAYVMSDADFQGAWQAQSS